MYFFKVSPNSGGGGDTGGVKVLSGSQDPAAALGKNGDIYFKTVKKGVLLHFDTDATTDVGGNIWTAYGTAAVSDEQSKFGGKSLYLGGANNYLQAEVSDTFNFATNDFTISCWIYPTATNRQCVFAMSTDYRISTDIFYGQGSANLWWSSTGSGWNILQSDSGGSNSGQGTIPISANEWTHIAYVRKGTSVRMYVNGQIAKDFTLINPETQVFYSGVDGFRIGRWGNNAMHYTGYIDEFLVINGAALWEDEFTPPTEPFEELPEVVSETYRKIDNVWVKVEGGDIIDLGSFTPPYGGNLKVLNGNTEPTAALGNDGDVYLQSGFKGSLLHFDNDFTDENNHIWTAGGTVVVTSDQAKFGGKSARFSNSHIQSDSSNDFNVANNDFTIACWIYPTVQSRMALFAHQGTGIAMDIFYRGNSANLWMSSTGNGWDLIQSDGDGTNSGIGTITINTNEWTHIAFVRKGNKVRSFVNGVLNKEVTITGGASVCNRNQLNIGAWDNGSTYGYTGYIDEFVMLNGVALWDSNFTHPNKPFSSGELSNLKVKTYQKVNGHWVDAIGSPITEKTIVEPMSVYTGSDNPTNILGKDNDIYLKNSNMTVTLPQIKINNAWQNLIGSSIEDIFFAKPIPAGIYGYTQLSYIKSDGDSWINPNLRYTTDMELEFGGRWDSVITAEQHFFGVWVSARESNFGAYNGNYFYEIGGSGTEAATSMDTNYHVIKVTQSQLLIDDTSVGAAPNWSSVVTDQDVYILCRNVSNASQNKATNFEFGYCKIWQGGNLIRDFVSCKRNYDNAIGLYDKVNDKFYQNNGTGEIIAGPVVTGGVITYKNYVHFTDGIGFTLPFTINADYKITVVFNDTTYKLGNAIIDNTKDSTHLRFGVYQNGANSGYYSSRGNQVIFWGTWNSGTHTFICNNGNNYNVFDGVEVATYTPTTVGDAKINVGGGNIHGEEQRTSPGTYFSRFKIESLSTGEVICDLRPAIQGQSTHCMYDIINDIAYTSSGLEVVDDIN